MPNDSDSTGWIFLGLLLGAALFGVSRLGDRAEVLAGELGELDERVSRLEDERSAAAAGEMLASQ